MVLTTNYWNKLHSVSQSVCESVCELVITDQREQDAPGLVISTNKRQFEMLFEELVDDRAVFQSLVQAWHSERGATSSVAKMVACPSYQRIISLGRAKAVELILAQMESEGNDPDHWFWALQILTGANPVPEEDEGNLEAMAKTWLDWARKSGYVWKLES